MKRLRIFLPLLLCICIMWVPVMAASSATQIQSNAAIASDGSCQISLTLGLHLDTAVSDLTFPIPANAADVLLNGTAAQTKSGADRLLVVLPPMNGGDHTVTIGYTLQNVVDSKEEKLILPLLSGFGYPIAAMEFTVSLPSAIEATPSFISGYYQQGIESSLIVAVSENAVHGYLKTGLKDHETLVMELPVDPTLFTPAEDRQPLLDGWDWAVLICVFLAAAYFCVTLLPQIPRSTRCFGVPDGIAAGEVGTCMTGCGTDLTMMVITWAQLGYILLEMDTRGRVILHKRMDMGNERSALEVRIFKSLFGTKTTIDGTGYHYAQLCRKLATKSAMLAHLYKPRSGNPKIFRGLCGAAAVLSGIQLGITIGGTTGVQTLLALLFGLLCAGFGYFIQSGGKCLPLRDKTPLLIALGCGLLWITLGAITKQLPMVIPMVIFQFLAGLGVAYGGKRSELGIRCLAQLLGLRRHMTTAKTFDLQQLMQKNPNYFYELAPYALALGVDKNFARRFGKTPLPESSYLDLGRHKDLTAAQWAAQLRRAADILNQRQKRLPYERLFGK